MEKEKTVVSAALTKAESYIAANKNKVNFRYRPRYHLTAEIGWINDPNGFCWYNGRIHEFFQYNPYDSVWGPVHWGHVVSDDMIKWERLPVALAPDMQYDDRFGCFSGSATVKDGKLFLMYTGVGKEELQQQCLAASDDGVNFVKFSENPVIGEDNVPDGASPKDFRDPFVYVRDGIYYCLVGTKCAGYGNIAMFRSDDLKNWSFVGYAFRQGKGQYVSEGVCECPSRAQFGDREVLFYSPQFLKPQAGKFRNIHSSVYIVGSFNYDTGEFVGGELQETDSGFDFYASQVTVLPDGRTVMTAWMQMWDRNIPSSADGWAGCMILPRELALKGDRLIQTPVREIKLYREGECAAEDIQLESEVRQLPAFYGDSSEISFTICKGTAKKSGIEFYRGGTHCTRLYYDATSDSIVLDRGCSGVDLKGKEQDEIYWVRSVAAPSDDSIDIRILLDNTTAEIFIGNGQSVLSANIYADATDDGVAFFAEGGTAEIKNAKKFTIRV